MMFDINKGLSGNAKLHIVSTVNLSSDSTLSYLADVSN